MNTKTYLGLFATAFALAACGNASDTPGIEDAEQPPVAAEIHPLLAEVATANYSLEKSHAFLTVKVPHNFGIAPYRISLVDIDGDLTFDPADPEASSISFAINPAAVEANYPGDYKQTHADSPWENWNEDISRDQKWLNADQHPEISFVSTSATRTGELTGTVTGDLTLLGMTKPITLEVTYNGVANPPWFGERDVIGFDATTTLLRSDFGMTAYAPLVGDELTVEFSGEFLQDE